MKQTIIITIEKVEEDVFMMNAYKDSTMTLPISQLIAVMDEIREEVNGILNIAENDL